MGQVPRSDRTPSRFLVIGSGRAASHISRYFELESLPYLTWSRQHDAVAVLTARASGCTHAILAISDRAIEPFARDHENALCRLKLVHLSGALSSPLAQSAHPLMTFGPNLYDLATYRSMPFALESGSLDDVMPGLSNRAFTIAPENKAYYHAWCAMSGNFTAMLWSAFFDRLENRLGVPREMALPYMRQQCANLETLGALAVTGPLHRGDHETVQKHLRALTDDSFKFVYEGFVRTTGDFKTEAQQQNGRRREKHPRL